MRTIRLSPNLNCYGIAQHVFTEAVSIGIQITADSNFKNVLMAKNTAIFNKK